MDINENTPRSTICWIETNTTITFKPYGLWKISPSPVIDRAEIGTSLGHGEKGCCHSQHGAGSAWTDKAQAIIAAADEIIEGKHLDQFIVDVIQGGAGTSLNMNATK